MGINELLQLNSIIRRNPAANREAGGFIGNGKAVFRHQALGQHVELQGPYNANEGARAISGQEKLNNAFLGQLLKRITKFLGLHRVLQFNAPQDFRGKTRHAPKNQFLSLRQRIADAKRSMIGNSDNITGIGLFDQSTVAGEEELWRVQRQWLAGAALYL